MLFKDYFYEGTVKVPTEEIRKWVDSHFEEFVTKLKETLKTGYNTDIEDYLILTNPYTNEKMEIPIEIQKNILSSNESGSLLRFDAVNRRVLINATNFYNEYKRNLKDGFISGLIHELTHAIDPGVANKKKKFTPGSYDDLVNSDIEMVALNREYIDRIKHLSDNKRLLAFDKIRKGKPLGIREIDDYLSSLNPENKRKFISQLVKEVLRLL